jgi:hypothetical protein
METKTAKTKKSEFPGLTIPSRFLRLRAGRVTVASDVSTRLTF